MRFGSAPLSSKDLAAHLIPGAVILALALWFLDGFVGLLINLMTLGTGIVSLVMWLIGAYAAGIFLQLFGSFLVGSKLEELEMAEASQFLLDGDPHSSADFKQTLSARARQVFGYVPAGREFYRLCLDYVAQRGAAHRAESLSAFGDMYRGLLAAAKVGVVVSLLIALKHLILLLLPQFGVIVPVTGFLDYETLHLAIGAMLAIIFGVGAGLLRSKVEACAEGAVSDVYSSFLALSSSELNSARP